MSLKERYKEIQDKVLTAKHEEFLFNRECELIIDDNLTASIQYSIFDKDFYIKIGERSYTLDTLQAIVTWAEGKLS